jgi:hypothetical protein
MAAAMAMQSRKMKEAVNTNFLGMTLSPNSRQRPVGKIVT